VLLELEDNLDLAARLALARNGACQETRGEEYGRDAGHRT
jgi:hypothetical protein